VETPTGTAPPAATAVPPPTPEVRRSHRRRWVAILVAAAVIAAGGLSAVAILTVPTSSPPPSFAEARSLANGTVSNLSGGGWTLLLGVGLAERAAETVAVTAVTNVTGSTCTPAALPGATLPTSVSVPAYSGGLNAGRAPFWAFVYHQASSGTYLLVQVSGRTPTAVARLTGSSCAATLGSLLPVPDRFVDSVGADAAAWSNASGFVAGDPAIDTVIMVASGGTTGGLITYPAGWLFEFTPCGPFASGTLTSRPTYVVGVDPAGTPTFASTSSMSCPAASG